MKKEKFIDVYEKNAIIWSFTAIGLFFVAGVSLNYNPGFAFAFVMIGLFCLKIYEINLKFHIKNSESK